MRENAAGLFGAEFSQGFADAAMLHAENGGGEERGVDGAGSADGKRADGNASGHLGDGEERVKAFEGFGFDGNTKDGKNGLCGRHAGEVGGSASAGG